MRDGPATATRLAAAGLAGLALLLAAPAVAGAEDVELDGQIGIRLLDAPLDRAEDPRARSNVVDHLAPGDEIERRVQVRNGTEEEITVPLYVGGAELEGDGFRAFDDRDRGDLARWGEVEPDEVTLAPGERAEPTMRLVVPEDAPAGERYGVVWVEAPSADDGPIEAVNRVGVRMYVSVGEGDEPPTDFQIGGLTAQRPDADTLLVRADVDNTGGRALDLRGELELADGPGGLAIDPVEPTDGRVLAVDESGTVDFALDPSLPEGQWDADVRLTSGAVERHAQGTLTIPPVGTSAGGDVAEADEAVPGWLLALALALLLGVSVALAVVLMRRRVRRDAAQRGDALTGPGRDTGAEVVAARVSASR